MRIRDDSTIEVSPSETLPMVCAKTGNPARRVMRIEVYDSPGLSWGLYVVGTLGFIAQLLGSEKLVVKVPFSEEVLHRYRVVNYASGAVVVIALVLSVFPPFFLLLILSLIGRWLLLRAVWIRARASHGRVILGHLSTTFVKACQTPETARST